MFETQTLDLPQSTLSRPESRRNSRRARRRSALQTACLAAGLITAFAGAQVSSPTPAFAVGGDHITSSTGVQIYDASAFINDGSGTSFFTLTQQDFDPTGLAGTGGLHIVIMTQLPGIFVGRSWESLFPGIDENLVIDDLIHDNEIEFSRVAFQNALGNFPGVIDGSSPIACVVFSDGSPGGFVVPDALPQGYTGGYGVGVNAVPEPGSLAAMLMGVAGIAGTIFARMRTRNRIPS